MPAGDVAFAADHITGLEVGDVRSDFHDFTDELMAHHHRHRNGFLRPSIPFIDVQIGPTYPRAIDPDEDIVRPGFRLGNVLQPQPRFGSQFHQRFHESPHASHVLIRPLYRRRRQWGEWRAIPAGASFCVGVQSFLALGLLTSLNRTSRRKMVTPQSYPDAMRTQIRKNRHGCTRQPAKGAIRQFDLNPGSASLNHAQFGPRRQRRVAGG
jgi:hypothetical protein